MFCGTARSLTVTGMASALALIAAMTPTVAETLKLRNAQAETLSFATLDGWKDDDHAAAFGAYMKSCAAILRGTKAMRRARPVYSALYDVCERAAAAGPLDRVQARIFFETNFSPVRVAPPGQSEGFYTGYYETEVAGSRVQTPEYSVPMYTAPANVLRGKKSKVFGDLDRAKIEEGALAGKKLEICWVKDPVDAFFAQIQGSTRVKLDDGKLMRLNYAAHNGLPYTPVGRHLIDRGIISKEDMSMDRIRAWMQANPDEGKELRRKNRSFVFFRETNLAEHEECIGAQGIPLTPGRSLAVDKKIHVYGTPIWIDAKLPIASETPETEFRRLLVAQDTGSAIIGAARADIYFGTGEELGLIAGRIKQFGKFVMLVPRSVAVKATIDIPIPKPRPKDIVADAAAAVSKP